MKKPFKLFIHLFKALLDYIILFLTKYLLKSSGICVLQISLGNALRYSHVHRNTDEYW